MKQRSRKKEMKYGKGNREGLDQKEQRQDMSKKKEKEEVAKLTKSHRRRKKQKRLIRKKTNIIIGQRNMNNKIADKNRKIMGME